MVRLFSNSNCYGEPFASCHYYEYENGLPSVRPEHVEGLFMVRQACPELVEGLTTNASAYLFSFMPRYYRGMNDSEGAKRLKNLAQGDN